MSLIVCHLAVSRVKRSTQAAASSTYRRGCLVGTRARGVKNCGKKKTKKKNKQTPRKRGKIETIQNPLQTRSNPPVPNGALRVSYKLHALGTMTLARGGAGTRA